MKMLKLSIACLLLAAPTGTAATAADVAAGFKHGTDMTTNFIKATPVLLAEDVDACVRFWTALGLTPTMTVPFGDALGFASLAAGDMEVMYQSFALSQAQGADRIEGVQRAVVYFEVRSLNAVLENLGDAPVVVPPYETDYGVREIYVRDPAGNLIGFAQAVGNGG